MSAAAVKEKPAKGASVKAKTPKPVDPIDQVPAPRPGEGKSNENLSVELDRIIIRPGNVRRELDDVDHLATSMSQVGQLQPIGVVFSKTKPGSYELIFGHRRLAAAKKLGWPTLAAQLLDENAALESRAAENLQRVDLDPIERAEAVWQMVEKRLEDLTGPILKDIKNKTGKLPAPEEDKLRRTAIANVAERLGKPIRWIQDHAFLATLDPTTRDLVVAGKLPLKYARRLTQVADPQKRAELAKGAAIGGGWKNGEFPMEERRFNRLIAEQISSLAGVPWRLDLAFNGAPACTECPHNSANQTGLFDVDGAAGVPVQGSYSNARSKEPESGVCLNRACYSRKSATANRQITTASKAVTLTVSGKKGDAKKEAMTEGMKIAAGKAPVVKPATLKREIEERRERYDSAASNRPKSSSSSRVQPKVETPEEKAKRALQLAMGDYARDAIVAMAKAATPLQTACLCLLDHCPTDSKKSTKHNRTLLQAAINADPAALMIAAGKKFSGHFELWDVPDEDVLWAAEQMGVKLPPRPKLEDFMPKAGAETPAKKSKMSQPPKVKVVYETDEDLDDEEASA